MRSATKPAAKMPQAVAPVQHLDRLRTEDTSRGEQIGITVLVLLSAVGVLAWYWQTTQSMIATWERSGTFAHGYLVFPISLYLVWRRRRELATIEPAPFWPGLILIVGAGFGWLLGELGSVTSVSQFAVVAMVPLVVWTILGTRFVIALLFPLAFLVFAVPFGEFLLPVMMNWTADFTVVALRLSGVPVFREGNNFAIPSGYWSVVEACSGVRYLIASMMIGSLFAHLNFRSWQRQAVFFAVSIAVPLVANWFRAYVIVMLGHLSNNAIATGVDHLIYGWVFFGFVMLMMFWVGSKWRDVEYAPAAGAAGDDAQPGNLLRATGRFFAVLAAAIVAVAMWKPLEPVLNASNNLPVGALAAMTPSNGWVEADAPVAEWRPHFGGPSAERVQTFTKGDARIGVYLGYYRNQSQGKELISSLNTIAPTTDKQWLRGLQGEEMVSVREKTLHVHSTEIRGPANRLLVWNWYWVDGRLTSNDHVAKAYLVWAKLLGRGDDSAVIAVYTTKDQFQSSSNGTLRTFIADMWPSMEATLRNLQGT